MASSASGRVIHHVWFKWKAGTSAEQISEVFRALVALKSDIPVIQEIHAGKNFTERSAGFTHGLTVVLGSKEDLGTYANHPAHQRVLKELIGPIKEDAHALDYVEGDY